MNSKLYKNFQVTTDANGITKITLDVPNRPLNVLTHEVMDELDAIVHELESGLDTKLVVFQSGKESGFLAGADVRVIADIESASHALNLIEAGQTLFQRIEWLPVPTVAVIHGPCLGGGLELALACDYRVARDNSSTQIGLPEIKLGLIPGWGGTQRLPRTAGLSNSLPMILTGKPISAKKAYRIGLVDRSIKPDRWDEDLAAFLSSALDGSVRSSFHRRPRWQRLLESTRLGRSLILRTARRSVSRNAENYPALPAALRSIRHAFDRSPDGFLCERSEFVDLLATPTCRSLLDLFFARERARNQTTWCSASHAAHQDPIRLVGIVGAGAMGAGIGQLAAVRGFDVVMKEVNSQAAAAGRHRIDELVEKYAKHKGWNRKQHDEVRSRISVGCDQAAMSDCDLVIEAVVERDDVKSEVFATLDQNVKSSAILASNTSSLSVSKMATATDRGPLVAGLHFFNPVHRMELVEVVRAADTDEMTIARLVAFVRALGKTPIVTADRPGFLVNRVLFPYLGEAVLMLGEGYSVDEIDRQVRRFGMPMGPLELLDQVGIDVATHVAKSLDDVLHGVTPVVNKLASMVERGQIGKKASLGFYEYHKGKRRRPASLPFGPIGERASTDDKNDVDDSLTPIQRRLIYPMLAEAVRCHEEGIVQSAWAIDLGMVLGTGFAPHRGGPLHVIDSLGIDRVCGNLKRLSNRHGGRFSPPAELLDMSREGARFFDSGERPQSLATPQTT